MIEGLVCVATKERFDKKWKKVQTECHAIVWMPLIEFSRICNDLITIDNTVMISVSKGVKFSTRGDIGTANVVCRQLTTVDKHCYGLHCKKNVSKR
uniref:Proliferating cell nuclear antigen n=1 Tax=Tanacetum cinerariifolium TaxID=118510 RepID=A0A6L2NY46_TANCI|nr:proliferating cell nuclear antigen [Tanacetum cinerariifolium]